mmetsp:Transcript_60588/g.131327  ORF Transcript_60588/g.131327 Transcript_60588/m.131327 type:complete len:120 (+) Transcript_60588:857-1216(+)
MCLLLLKYGVLLKPHSLTSPGSWPPLIEVGTGQRHRPSSRASAISWRADAHANGLERRRRTGTFPMVLAEVSQVGGARGCKNGIAAARVLMPRALSALFHRDRPISFKLTGWERCELGG